MLAPTAVALEGNATRAPEFAAVMSPAPRSFEDARTPRRGRVSCRRDWAAGLRNAVVGRRMRRSACRRQHACARRRRSRFGCASSCRRRRDGFHAPETRLRIKSKRTGSRATFLQAAWRAALRGRRALSAIGDIAVAGRIQVVPEAPIERQWGHLTETLKCGLYMHTCVMQEQPND
jgi:hypothetical protein